MKSQPRFCSQSPKFSLLSPEAVEEIYQQALIILEETGVKFHSPRALEILQSQGAKVELNDNTVRFSPELVQEAIASAPDKVELYNLKGDDKVILGGDRLHFVPGSAALNILADDGETTRRAQASDLVRIARLTEELENIALQSSSVVLSDVPDKLADSYRLYLLLKNSSKPIVTGAFSRAGIINMEKMLKVVAGSRKALQEKPRAVFDICPSPPLKWSEISSHNIIDCANLSLPQELISLPMPGAASPVTLAGSVLLHTAEILSGLTLAQLVNPGTPVIYGGAPVNFDMKAGTTPMSAVEATMIGACCSQIGKYLNLPTHTYAALSDAKVVDAQAGLETALSGTLASLAKTNLVSGPGILDFVDTFSLEKLVIDNEICGMALRLARGVEVTEKSLAADLIAELGPGGSYLDTGHTLGLYREESYYPSSVIDRRNRSDWERQGKKSIFARASQRIKELTFEESPAYLSESQQRELKALLKDLKAQTDIAELPLE